VNAFLSLADAQQTAASKRAEAGRERRLAKLVVKSERDAPMVASPAERAQFEKQQLNKQYTAAMTARKIALLTGRWAPQVQALVTLLDHMTLESASNLIGYVKDSPWLKKADRHERADILWLIDTAIVRLRVRNGLAPFDDGLFDEEPAAFIIIRNHLLALDAVQ
jgi:hypothetical protein